jgi:lipopolysaccharide export system permease protein
MNVLSRYFIREFFKLFFLCQTGFSVLFLVIDFIQNINNFIEAQVSKGVMFAYYYFKAPYIIVQMTPVATLISVIIMLCMMKKSNEITALKACGLNLLRTFQPIMAASLLVAVVLFLFLEIVVPYTSTRSNEIWRIEVDKQDPTRFYGSTQIWYKGSHAIYWLSRFDYNRKVMETPTFYFFDNAFRIIKRIDGRKGFWDKGRWIILDGILQTAEEGGGYRLERFDELPLNIPETPDTFVRGVKGSEEMSYWQLKRYSQRVRQEGYDDTRYRVDMHLKIAFPFVCVILAFIGIPITLKVKKGGAPLALSAGVGLCFFYMFALGFSRSLGFSGALPPILAAWASNLLFLLGGVYALMHIER